GNCFAHPLDCRRIDDHAGAFMTAQRAQQQFTLRPGVSLAHDVAQIWAIEACDVFVSITQAELIDDVVPHMARRARGERRYRNFREFTSEVFQLPVLGPEVVPPFRDAVRLVNYEERNRRSLEPLDRVVANEALRRKIKQAILPALRALNNARLFPLID